MTTLRGLCDYRTKGKGVQTGTMQRREERLRERRKIERVEEEWARIGF